MTAAGMPEFLTAGERPKVAVFASRFLPISQTFIYDQLINHQRYEAHVFTRERLNLEQFPYSAVHYLTPGRGWQGGLEAVAYRTTAWNRGFFHALRDGGFRLLHGHFGPASCYALPYAARLRLPLVVTFHGHDVALLTSRERLLPRNWPYWAASHWLLRSADRLLPVSDDLARMLVKLGASPNRIRVHRLGTDTSIKPRSERKDGYVRIMMAGRFVEKKGFEYGIRAFASIAAEYPEARLSIIGDGPKRPMYLELIEALGIGDRVEVQPFRPHAQVLQEMQRSDVALVPSVTARHGDREGNPMVIREAGAVGLATIASRHAGIPEMIQHDRTGLLVRERDVEGLAEALRRLLANVDLRNSLGQAARSEMQRGFSHAERMHALEGVYDEVVSSYTAGRR